MMTTKKVTVSMKLSLNVGYEFKQKKSPFWTSLLRRLHCPVSENEWQNGVENGE